MSNLPPQANIPSVDRLLNHPPVAGLIEQYGRTLVTDRIRELLAELRQQAEINPNDVTPTRLFDVLKTQLEDYLASSLKPVFNLTGTVLHTNLGRAPLPETAVQAVAAVARGASNLEFDLNLGKRGDRDDHVAQWLCRLTGAEAATVVNNNAAAVLLTLNSLALGKSVPVSRGELVEIGGAFRIPEVMTRANCKLREVGTTNRTHPKDYREAIDDDTALLMKVHTSNYEIQGFTASVDERTMVDIAHEYGLPLVIDLGSGTLVNLEQFGLPHEPTPMEALKQGADVVTFSGDKLLGGPQAGLIVGKAELIAKIKKNPMKRALRVDKMTLAALEEVLKLYADPDRLKAHLPVVRLLSRPVDEIAAQAMRILPAMAQYFDGFQVSVEACRSQIGSGALPVDLLASKALVLKPVTEKKPQTVLKALERQLLDLPKPVVGRISNGAFWLDLRCLDDEASFINQLNTIQRN